MGRWKLEILVDVASGIHRTQKASKSTKYPVERLAGVSPGRTSAYDALGRMTSVTFAFGSFSKTVGYTYDENSNRKTMVYPGGFTVTYVWDADNRLVALQVPGKTWTFLYDVDIPVRRGSCTTRTIGARRRSTRTASS